MKSLLSVCVRREMGGKDNRTRLMNTDKSKYNWQKRLSGQQKGRQILKRTVAMYKVYIMETNNTFF